MTWRRGRSCEAEIFKGSVLAPSGETCSEMKECNENSMQARISSEWTRCGAGG